MKIAHYGTFDVLNYGDLLFPVVARHFLSTTGAEFTWVSPKGGDAVCPDSVPTVSLMDAARDEFVFNLALIGGGNIVRFGGGNPLEAYSKPSYLSAIAYPGLWISACLKAADLGAAIAWNAPGLAAKFSASYQRAALQACISYSDHTAFREPGYMDWLRELQPAPSIIPDTAITISKVWPKQSALSEALAAMRQVFSIEGDFFVFHVKPRNIKEPNEPDIAARTVEQLAAATGALPVLLPIGLCHGDDSVLLTISQKLSCKHRLIYGVQGLKSITALLAHASFVFTTSLHGAIVATSYGVPCRLLANIQLLKYRGFFDQLGLSEIILDNWPEVSAMNVATIRAAQHALFAATDRASDTVSLHFKTMVQAVTADVDRKTRGKALRKQLMHAFVKQFPISAYLPLGGIL
jgi:hypothetical protein